MKTTLIKQLSYLASILLLVLVCSSCGEKQKLQSDTSLSDASSNQPDSSAVAKPDPGTKNLQTLIAKLQKHIHGNDVAEAAAMTKDLLLSEDQVKNVLASDCPQETINAIKEAHAQFLSAPNEKLAPFLRADPENTEIKGYAATGLEIKENSPNSVVAAEFPGGTVKAAQNGILDLNRTYYEVELTKSGEPRGMKFHLFTWDGTQWKMLGPIWRFIR